MAIISTVLGSNKKSAASDSKDIPAGCSTKYYQCTKGLSTKDKRAMSLNFYLSFLGRRIALVSSCLIVQSFSQQRATMSTLWGGACFYLWTFSSLTMRRAHHTACSKTVQEYPVQLRDLRAPRRAPYARHGKNDRPTLHSYLEDSYID
jgi:hypothetical protein